MRLVVCCFKGGVGRTTLSLNLAAAFAGQSRVLVNDRDPQCGSVAWSAMSDGETPFTVNRASSPGFDLEIQDLPPSAPVKDQLPDADLYIVPTLLDGGSYVVYLRTIDTLRRQGKPFLPVANRVNLKRAEHRRRLEDPSLAGAIVIPERAALASYYELGETVFSMRGTGVDKAREDILRVGQAIQKIGQPGAGACMMELPMLPLPDLMAAKKTPAKNAVAKARKDLSKAAKVVHAKPERTYAPLIDLGQFSEGQLAELMVAAGDAPGRRTYFDYSEERPYLRDGQRVHLDVGRDSTMFDYRDENGARVERTMVTVPPKLREQIQDVTGEEQPILTTALIALASWACQELKKSKRRLVVTTATDDLDPMRRQVRKAIVGRARKQR